MNICVYGGQLFYRGLAFAILARLACEQFVLAPSGGVLGLPTNMTGFEPVFQDRHNLPLGYMSNVVVCQHHQAALWINMI